MKRIIFLLTIIIMISNIAGAEDEIFAEGLQNTNYHGSMALSPQGRTIVLVWEHVNAENTFRDIQLLVVNYSKSGKFSSKKVISISGSRTSTYPHVAYNSESKRFLVTWAMVGLNSGSEIYGQVLTSKGKLAGKARVFYSDTSTSYYSPIAVPLLNKAHKGLNKGDFLVAASPNLFIPQLALKQFNSRNGQFFEIDTSGWKFVYPSDMAVTPEGQILVFGTTPYPSSELGLLSFKLGVAKASYFKVASFTGYLNNPRLTAISPSLFITNWSTSDSNNVYKHFYRLVRSTGKPKGGMKSNNQDYNTGDANFLLASDGILYNASRNNLGAESVINTYSSKGKFKGDIDILSSEFADPSDMYLVELEGLDTLLIYYKKWESSGAQIRGYLHPLEK